MNTMSQTRWKIASKGILAFWTVAWLSVCSSQAQASVNVDDLLRELMRQASTGGRVTLVFWMPEEYWRAAAESQGILMESAIEEVVGIVRPYMVIAAIDAAMTPYGESMFLDESLLRESIRVVDSRGVEYPPLAASEISTGLRKFLELATPPLKEMLGPMGEGLHFYVFPPRSRDGGLIADPKEPGSFAVRVGNQVLEWQLPLGSLLPPRVCPEDGELLNGAWKYCPWHGNELEVMETSQERSENR